MIVTTKWLLSETSDDSVEASDKFRSHSLPRCRCAPCPRRVILDIPLSVFMTMFGFPPDSLYSEELHRKLKIAENKKVTVREAPREYCFVRSSM